MNNNIERELGWDEQIEKESDFIVLPEGDYDFVVTGFERGRHPGSEKLPPCNKAIVTLQVETPQGTANILHNLFLHTKTEGMLSAFFTAIGQKKHGERTTMNWNAVVGSKGRCKLATQVYNGNTYNNVKRFYDPEESKPNFEAGRF